MTKHKSYHQDRREIREQAADEYFFILNSKKKNGKKYTRKEARHIAAEKFDISERTVYRAKASRN